MEKTTIKQGATLSLADAPAVIQQRKVSRESLLDGERVLEMAAH